MRYIVSRVSLEGITSRLILFHLFLHRGVGYGNIRYYSKLPPETMSKYVLTTFSRYRYTTFQEGVLCNSQHAPVQPTSLQEIRAIVKNAVASNTRVKALGSLHSGTDIICTSGLPVDMSSIRHIKYEKESGVVWVGSGTTLTQLFSFLHDNGRTVEGIPTYADITIGGAIGTGAHGSSLSSPASLSDIIIGVVVVDGLGKMRNVTDTPTVNAFRTHLGLLGIIYEVA